MAVGSGLLSDVRGVVRFTRAAGGLARLQRMKNQLVFFCLLRNCCRSQRASRKAKLHARIALGS